jgi:exonuclease SbcC
MKPINLRIKGINNIKEEQSIDFDLLLSSGIFGIFGPTGSGKSTILDSIIIALYGTGSIPRGSKSFINSDMKKAFINFSFDININGQNKIVTVERSFKSNKNTNGVLSDKVRLSIESEGVTEEILDRVQDVDNKIIDIIGLRSEDFVKSVVLPQGKFSEFLKLSGKNRRDMLERILNLEKYGSKLQDKIRRIRRELDKDIEVVRGKLAVLGDRTSKELKEIEKDRKDADKEKEEKKSQLLELDKRIELIGKRDRTAKEIEELKALVNEYEDNIDYWNGVKESLELTKKCQPILKIDDDIKSNEVIRSDLRLSEEALREKHTNMKKQLIDLENKLESIFLEKKESLPQKKLYQKQLETILELKEKLDKLSRKLTLKDTESQELKNEILSIKNHLKEIDENKKEKESILRDTVDKIEEMTVDIHFRESLKSLVDLLKERKSLSEDIKKNKCEKDINKKSLAESEETVDKLEKSKKDLEEKIVNSKEAEKELKKHMDELAKEISLEDSIRENIDLIKNNLSGLQEDLNKSKNSLNGKKSEERKLRKLVDNEMDSFDLSVIGMAIRDKLNEGDVCPVCMGTYNHLGLMETREGAFSSDILQVIQSREKLMSLSFEISHMDMEIEKIVKGIDKEDIRKEDLEDKLKTIMVKKKKMDEAAVKMNSLLDDIDIKESKVREVEKEIILLTLKMKRNMEDVENIEIRIADSEKSLSAVNYEIDKLSIDEKYPEDKLKTILDNEKKVNDLRIVRSELDNQLIVINNNYNEKNLRIVSLERDMDNSLKIIKDLSIEVNEVESQIGLDHIQKDTRTQYEEISSYIDNFEKNELDTQEDLRMVKNRFDNLDKNYNDLCQKIVNYGEIIEKLENELYSMIKSLELPDDYKERIYDKESFESLNSDYYMGLEKYNNSKSRFELLTKDLNNYQGINETIEEALSSKEEVQISYNEIIKKLGNFDVIIEEYKMKLQQVIELEKEKSHIEKSIHDYSIINDLIKGNKLVDFISKGEMEYILADATNRLMKLTGNRYSLGMDMNGNFIVSDYYNSGISRDINSLSGGESFLTSLSMALALSSKIQMKSKSNIDFFFLDEGFGTLDSETLETVLSSLEKLKFEQLSVGIISHVEEIKHRINSKIVLEKEDSNTKIKMIVG